MTCHWQWQTTGYHASPRWHHRLSIARSNNDGHRFVKVDQIEQMKNTNTSEKRQWLEKIEELVWKYWRASVIPHNFHNSNNYFQAYFPPNIRLCISTDWNFTSLILGHSEWFYTRDKRILPFSRPVLISCSPKCMSFNLL